MSKLAFNPNKIDLVSWNQPKQQQQLQQQQQQQDYEMSKDGVQNLKARFYAPPGGHSQPQLPPQLQQQQQTAPQKTRLVSQQNYLFNSKNARQYNSDQSGANNNNENDYGDNGYDNNGYYNSAFSDYNEQIASSDL